MHQFAVIVTEQELKALEWDIYDVQGWIQNAISEKARRAMDRLIEQNTNLNFKKLTKTEKDAEIGRMAIKTAKQRQKEFEQEEENESKDQETDTKTQG